MREPLTPRPLEHERPADVQVVVRGELYVEHEVGHERDGHLGPDAGDVKQRAAAAKVDGDVHGVLAVYFGSGGTLFDITRIGAEMSIPLMSNFILNVKFASDNNLDIGWTFTF